MYQKAQAKNKEMSSFTKYDCPQINGKKMKKVLVNGISGFVGQHCAAELLKKGYAVRGSVRSLSRTDEVTNGIKKEIDPKGN